MNTPSSPPRRQRRPTPRAGFWELHGLLFAHQDALSPDDLYRFAAELSLDVERFSEELRTRRHAPRVARDVESGGSERCRRHPHIFINGRRHYGAYDLDTLTGSVEGEARAALAAGVDPADPRLSGGHHKRKPSSAGTELGEPFPKPGPSGGVRSLRGMKSSAVGPS